MDDLISNVPMTLVCSKATEDIKAMLEGVMSEHGLPEDLMCMILRDVCAHFERKRANTYADALIQLTAVNDALEKENEALKQTSQLFGDLEGNDDNTNDKP